MNQKKLKVGDIVLFRVSPNDLECANNNVKVLPAVVVRVWNDQCANLRVLTDGNAMPWKTSVSYSENPDHTHTWYWGGVSEEVAEAPATA